MKSISYSVAIYFFVFVCAVGIGTFTWANLTSKYAHHLFFTKNTFSIYTAANILLLAPFILQRFGYVKSFPHILAALQIIGLIIYVGFAVHNVYSTSVLMGLSGTTFQFIFFWALCPLFLALIILRILFSLLSEVIGSFISSDEDNSWPQVIDELDDVVDEQLRRKKEIEENLHRGY